MRVVGVAVALLSIGAGVIHLSAAGDHRNLPVMMVGFLCVATAQVAFGALCLWRRPGRLLLALGLALMAGSVGMWLASRTVGLPFLAGGHMEPIGFKDGVAVLFELGALAAGLLLASRDLAQVRLPTPRLGAHALGILGAGMFALSVPALVLGGGEHHSAEQHAAMHARGGEHTADGHAHDGEQLAAAGPAHAGGAHARGGGALAGHAAAKGGSGHRDAGVLHAGGGSHPAGGDAPAAGGHRDGGHDDTSGAPGSGHGGGSEGGGDAHGRGDGAAAGHDAHGEGSSPEDGVAFETGGDGKGDAIVWRGKSSGGEGPGHHGDSGPCNPSAEQRAAADALVRNTAQALRRYENNPARALADGFYYAFGPTDRTMHMVSPQRLDEPDVLNPARIESFLYAMTDQGWVAIGGMYIMPKHDMKGPEIGGCLTKWHHHGGVGGRIASAGTMETTPEMLHVWTYPGLDPWGHYDGRDFSQLFTPGSAVPSFCRQFGDASDVCLP